MSTSPMQFAKMGIIVTARTSDKVSVCTLENLSRNQIFGLMKQTVDDSLETSDPIQGMSPIMASSVVQGSGDTTDHTNKPPVTLDQIKLPCSPDLIEKLSVVGRVPLSLSAPLMEQCKKLSVLHLHLSCLADISHTSPAISLVLDSPTLKSLVIDSFGIKEHWEQLGQKGVMRVPETVFDIIVTLLNNNTFSKLQLLMLEVPYCEQKESEVVNTIATFLGRHVTTVSSFCYVQGYKVKTFKPTKPNSASQESEDQEETHVSLRALAEALSNLKTLQLQEFHIGMYCHQDSYPLWVNLLISQTSFKKLIFTGIGIPFPETTIRLNVQNLETLIMEVRDAVDIQCLHLCPQLKKLCLLGSSENDGYLEKAQVDEMDSLFGEWLDIFNFTALPKTLQHLRINRLRTDAREVHTILCSGEWNLLKDVEIIECGGRKGNGGVSLDTISHILEAKTLQRFNIEHSLNKKSVDEAYWNQSAVAFWLKCNPKLGETLKVHGQLNSFGKYDMVEEGPQIGINNENDVFEFPEEIYPTGSHRKVNQEEDEDDDESEQQQTENGDNTNNNESEMPSASDAESNDDGSESSYEDITDRDE